MLEVLALVLGDLLEALGYALVLDGLVGGVGCFGSMFRIGRGVLGFWIVGVFLGNFNMV